MICMCVCIYVHVSRHHYCYINKEYLSLTYANGVFFFRIQRYQYSNCDIDRGSFSTFTG